MASGTPAYGVPRAEADDVGRSAVLPAPPSDAALRLREIHRAATRMRPHAWLSDPDPIRFQSEVLGPLSGLLGEARAAMRLLGQEDEEEELLDGFDDDWTMPVAPIPSGSEPKPAVQPRIGDIAFTAQLELGETLARLDTIREHQEIVVECDRARRKLRRCIEAVICAVPDTARPSVPPGPEGDPVRQAIMVRTAYVRFRSSIPACDATDPEAVFQVMRTAVNAVSKLLGGPAYEFVRHADRMMLRSLQARMIEWSRSPSHGRGAMLHKDLVTTADLLRDINKRQELAAHDDMLMVMIRGRLEMSSLDPSIREAILDDLDSLCGRDDELDELADALRSHWTRVEVENVLDCLDRLVPSTRVFPISF